MLLCTRVYRNVLKIPFPSLFLSLNVTVSAQCSTWMWHFSDCILKPVITRTTAIPYTVEPVVTYPIFDNYLRFWTCTINSNLKVTKKMPRHHLEYLISAYIIKRILLKLNSIFLRCFTSKYSLTTKEKNSFYVNLFCTNGQLPDSILKS
jgi:hypothetical protein